MVPVVKENGRAPILRTPKLGSVLYPGGAIVRGGRRPPRVEEGDSLLGYLGHQKRVQDVLILVGEWMDSGFGFRDIVGECRPFGSNTVAELPPATQEVVPEVRSESQAARVDVRLVAGSAFEAEHGYPFVKASLRKPVDECADLTGGGLVEELVETIGDDHVAIQEDDCAGESEYSNRRLEERGQRAVAIERKRLDLAGCEQQLSLTLGEPGVDDNDWLRVSGQT